MSHRCRQSQLRRELPHQRPQVDVHGVAAERDRLRLVLDDVDELLSGQALRALPRLLHAGASEKLERGLLRDRSQAAGGGSGERLSRGGSAASQLAGDVDVGVDLVDHEIGDLGFDRVVLQQRAAGVGPVIGVEHLPVGPHRQRSQRDEDGRHDQQHADQDPSAAGCGPRRSRSFGRLAAAGFCLLLGVHDSHVNPRSGTGDGQSPDGGDCRLHRVKPGARGALVAVHPCRVKMAHPRARESADRRGTRQL